jgi:thymidine kinase
VAQLVFFSGTMDSGKSTLALQMDHNHAARGRDGLIFSRNDRAGGRVDYLICDEVQFYSPTQVEQLARLVDEMGVDVFGFGITTDFRTRLFPGSARMLELADRVERLQVEALCWCGARATHNARTVDGEMVTEGEQVVVGDTTEARTPISGAQGEVGYEVLCRFHHLRRVTAARAHAASLSPQTLPLGD